MRTWTLGAILAVVTVLAIAAPAATRASAHGNHEPDEYVALGDSLAVGTGATDEAHLGYVAHIFRGARILSRGEINTLTNLSDGGETSATFISDGQLAAAVAAINADSDVRFVTIDIGGDDLLPLLSEDPCASNPTGGQCQYLVGMALNGLIDNLPTILGTLQAALAEDPGEEQLMIMTYYNPFSGTGSPLEVPVDGVLLGTDGTIDCVANQTDPTRVGLNDVIACIGAGAGATVVDVYPAFQGRGALLTHIAENDVHPNNFGHFVIAREFGRAARS